MYMYMSMYMDMRIVNTCSETNEEVDVKEALPL